MKKPHIQKQSTEKRPKTAKPGVKHKSKFKPRMKTTNETEEEH